MRFCFSLDEATKQVMDLEREVLIKLGMRDTPLSLSIVGFSFITREVPTVPFCPCA